MGPPMTAEHGIHGSDGHPVCLMLTCVAAVLAVLVPGCIGHSCCCNVPWQGTGRTSVRCGRVCHAFPGGRPHTARGQTRTQLLSWARTQLLSFEFSLQALARGTRRVELLPRIDIPPFNTAPEERVFGCLLKHTSPFPLQAPVKLVLSALLQHLPL